jgi:hypothetical protein
MKIEKLEQTIEKYNKEAQSKFILGYFRQPDKEDNGDNAFRY